METILFIDSSTEIQQLVQPVFDQFFRLIFARSLDQAKSALVREAVDFVVMEKKHPDGDGFDFCNELKRREREIPFLFVHSSSQIEDKLKAFELGAEDYLVKPFDPRELLARTRVRLGRLNKETTLDKSEEPSESLQRGELRFDLNFHRAFLLEEGLQKNLNLTPAEFKILYFLARKQGEIYSREQLVQNIWKNDSQIMDENIYTHISAIRKKLGDKSRYIQCIPRVGYRFVITAAGKGRDR